jgi:hypothetical protein
MNTFMASRPETENVTARLRPGEKKFTRGMYELARRHNIIEIFWPYIGFDPWHYIIQDIPILEAQRFSPYEFLIL